MAVGGGFPAPTHDVLGRRNAFPRVYTERGAVSFILRPLLYGVDASGTQSTLPRAKEVSPGHFFSPWDRSGRFLDAKASIWCCSVGVYERYFPLGAAPSIPNFPVPGQNLGQKETPGHQTGNQALKWYFRSYCLTASTIAARQ